MQYFWWLIFFYCGKIYLSTYDKILFVLNCLKLNLKMKEEETMVKTLEIKKNIYWTGILDPNLRVFDIIMETEFGSSYNSYVVKGSEKVALFETSKEKFLDEYLDKVKSIVDIQDIDYIVVDHTEPDHAGSAKYLIEENPSIKVVGSASAINFMKEIVNGDFNSIIVKDGDEISLGDKTLRFISAPNLHWPDSMYTYIPEDKLLVSCDSFGSHYTPEEVLYSKVENHDDYMKSLRYYYDCIMGPFKSFVKAAIEKIRPLDIDMIAPGHGPVLDKDPWKIVDIYDEWSTEVNPNSKKTVVMPYVSAYGYTEKLSHKIEEGIKAAGDIEVKKFDLVFDDMAMVAQEMYWADGVLLGTPTILGDALKPIWDLTTSIFPVTHGGKIASAFGSYGWSGEGVPHILGRLKQLRMKIYGDGYKIRFNPSQADLEGAFEFGFGFGKSILAGKVVDADEIKAMSVERDWKCLICGEIIKGVEAPEACPVCGVGPEQFVAVESKAVGFTSNDKKNIVIIGGGIAALRSAEAVRNRNEVCSIEIISNEDVLCYNRPMLTKGLLSEFEPLNFYTKQQSWYDEKNIKATLNTEVVKIDREAKELTLSDGSTRVYDKLIYATGAECNVPPIPGHDKEGVKVIRKLKDANDIRENMKDIENVVVIGGGILGLEAAWEFMRAKKNVAIVEVSPAIMGRQLDSKSSLLLKAAAEAKGATVSVGVGIEEIAGEGKVNGVKLVDGTFFDADIVVISAGVVPNTALAKEAGLEVDRFVVVNENMQTSDENIYACGDVASFNGVSIGIWPQAEAMSKVAGANAIGDSLEYSPITPSTAFNGFGTTLFSIGDVGHNVADGHYKDIEIVEEAKGYFKKLFFLNGKFCGGILMGNVSKVGDLMKAYDKKVEAKDEIIMNLLAQ